MHDTGTLGPFPEVALCAGTSQPLVMQLTTILHESTRIRKPASNLPQSLCGAIHCGLLLAAFLGFPFQSHTPMPMDQEWDAL